MAIKRSGSLRLRPSATKSPKRGYPKYHGRILLPVYPSVPAELAGKWIARGPERLIVASGDTLSEVMAEVTSKGIVGVSYGRVPRFDRQRAR
jgi:hypothetical protein